MDAYNNIDGIRNIRTIPLKANQYFRLRLIATILVLFQTLVVAELILSSCFQCTRFFAVVEVMTRMNCNQKQLDLVIIFCYLSCTPPNGRVQHHAFFKEGFEPRAVTLTRPVAPKVPRVPSAYP